MTNLNHIPAKLRQDIEDLLTDPAIHDYCKSIIRQGLDRDCLSAYRDARLAAEMLRKVSRSILMEG